MRARWGLTRQGELRTAWRTPFAYQGRAEATHDRERRQKGDGHTTGRALQERATGTIRNDMAEKMGTPVRPRRCGSAWRLAHVARRRIDRRIDAARLVDEWRQERSGCGDERESKPEEGRRHQQRRNKTG